MTPEGDRRFLDEILRVVDKFEHGGMDVVALQSALVGCSSTLDNSSKDVLDELRQIDGDLEMILSARPLAAQRPEALARVRKLRDLIEHRLQA